MSGPAAPRDALELSLEKATADRSQMALLLLGRVDEAGTYRSSVPGEHRAILAAITARDVALAERLVAEHVDDAYEQMRQRHGT